MRKITLGQRLRYHFDNSLSGGTTSLIAWLAVITLALVLTATIVLVLTKWQPAGGEPEETAQVEEIQKDSEETAEKTELPKAAEKKGFSFIEGFWQSLMRSLDAGTVAGDPAEDNGDGWAFRLWGLIVTFGGIFIVATLISIISSGLEAKLEDLRKGHSLVVEKGHTLILGWSPRIFLILRELIEANKNAHKPRIVILANKDKLLMEEEIASRIDDTFNTKIICRSGSPIDLKNLDIANPQSSKSIIILSPRESADPDAQVVKQILALTNSPNRRDEPYHIVAELIEKDNIEAAKMVGKDEVELVVAEDLISRITVQTSLQIGLSIVYKDLLGFSGDEIYFADASNLEGKTYGESLFLYEDCAVIGIANQNGKVKMNPSAEVKFGKGDQVMVLAEDDEKIAVSGTPQIAENQIIARQKTAAEVDKILILGWNHKGAVIIRELDHYVKEGSELVVVSETAETESVISGVKDRLKNLSVEWRQGDTTNRQMLDSMDLTSFNHIIILSYEEYERNESDSKTLMTLLHLRDIESKKGEAYSIVSEMLDVRNRALAVIAEADDFIVSDELAGLLLTQISENKLLSKVFDDLFNAEGSEIYLKPVKDYVKSGQSVNFYTIVESAKRNKETAIGYRLMEFSNDAEKEFGVVINPKKSEEVEFSPDDLIIVLAEN